MERPRPHSRTLRKTNAMHNECHVAWDSFPQTHDEGHAAMRLPGNAYLFRMVQTGVPKSLQTLKKQFMYDMYFFGWFVGPDWTTRVAHAQKLDQPKWEPKSAQSDCANYGRVSV